MIILEIFKRLGIDLNEIKNIFEKLNGDGSGNKFLSSYDQLYEYLDGLSILEELALLHIIIYLLLLITVFNIILVLFGNELIKLLKLEERFPSLAIYFRLRSQFQRYYLMWSVSLLFIVCIAGIFINILAFTTG